MWTFVTVGYEYSGERRGRAHVKVKGMKIHYFVMREFSWKVEGVGKVLVACYSDCS